MHLQRVARPARGERARRRMYGPWPVIWPLARCMALGPMQRHAARYKQECKGAMRRRGYHAPRGGPAVGKRGLPPKSEWRTHARRRQNQKWFASTAKEWRKTGGVGNTTYCTRAPVNQGRGECPPTRSQQGANGNDKLENICRSAAEVSTTPPRRGRAHDKQREYYDRPSSGNGKSGGVRGCRAAPCKPPTSLLARSAGSHVLL
jgi:hypothetical protein